jgi:hypothetical protein
VLEGYYGKHLAKQFGDTPPTPEQEITFIEGILNSGVRQAPLMDGSDVMVAADGGADAVNAEGADIPVQGGAQRNTRIRLFAGLGLLVVAAIAVIAVVPGLSHGGSSSGKKTPTPNAGALIDGNKLPTGIDALVSSGDTKSTLVLPRTLELTDGISTTTYIIVPVKVEQADWPCEAQKDNPVACWVVGTVVNYLVGIPTSDRSAMVMARRIRDRGGIVRLRFSTERVLTFRASVIDVDRHQSEVLAQDHLGITIPLLGGSGASRVVIIGDYEPETNGSQSPVAGGAGPGLDSNSPLLSMINLGQSARIGMVEITPIGSMQHASESRLTLRVHNMGTTPLALSSAAGWLANALLKSGTSVSARIEGSGINPGDTAVVSVVASGETSAWRLSIGNSEITVVSP